jgi:aminoglycoside phosphotransferase (APT) family kinase protein
VDTYCLKVGKAREDASRKKVGDYLMYDEDPVSVPSAKSIHGAGASAPLTTLTLSSPSRRDVGEPMELPAIVVPWIEDVVGGRVTSIEQQGRWRPHFFVDVEKVDGSIVPLLVRFPRDPELIANSNFLSHFDIAREARVLSALQGRGLVLPKFYGFNEQSQAILMERVEGTNDLTDLDAETRHSVLSEYFENLARLHSLAIDDGGLGEEDLPSNAEQLALANKFRYMELDFEAVQKVLRPEPLLEFAVWWIHAHVPQDRTRASWVQGDTGPGQFMVHAGHISALIDWELSHLGDPMLDLGVMRMRNMLYPVGDLREHFGTYAEVRGEPLHAKALCFYTVLSMLLSPLGMASTIQSPDPGIGSMIPRFGWDVTLRRGLCDALCEAYGVSVDPPLLPEPQSVQRTDLTRFLAAYLEELCLPVGKSDYEQFVLRGAIGVAQAVELQGQLGRVLEADDLDDMGSVLGVRPVDREDGLRQLSELVAADPASHALDLLWTFSRMEQRRDFLWGPMMIAQASQPLERLYPAERQLRAPINVGGLQHNIATSGAEA